MEIDSDIDDIIDMSDIIVDQTSFAWSVDSAIRSTTPSILGESRVPSFASVVYSAIRSRTASNLGTSSVHSFASPVDMRTIATRLSQAVSKAKTHVHGFQLFTLSELVAATNNFSTDYKIGMGSFGVVYRGYLADGREVAIKRGKTGSKIEFQQQESQFVSELVLSRLNHKHLIGLVGFCEKKYERLLVYEYMDNGALSYHLHDKNNVQKGSSSVLNNWKMRIKIALDASRGIEYLHNYAVPSLIHRNITSANILLDAAWTARVSGFGLSLMIPKPDGEYEDEVRGTFGYLDPEYFKQRVVTAKSDVYGFGVVLLELLTGKKSSMPWEDGETPFGFVVEYAVPAILGGELVKILDPRVGPPDVNEAEAVQLVANTAIHCVNLEGKDRPIMVDVVVNLEPALAICDSSPYHSISSGTISDLSE